MPAEVLSAPLRLVCLFTDGSEATWDLSDVPNVVLMADLARGLAALVHPHGSVGRVSTMYCHVLNVKHMVRWLADAGFRGGVAELTWAKVAEYWMASTAKIERSTRAVLACLDDTVRLRPDVVELIEGRHFHTVGKSQPLAPYSESEWGRLREVCRRVVDEAYAAHRRVRRAAEAGQHPADGGWDVGNVAWLLRQHGPCSGRRFGELVGCSRSYVYQLHGEYSRTNDALFPHIDTVLAYRLLFGIYTGVVPDGLDGLGLDDIDWAGEGSVLLSYVKGRTSGESVTLPRQAVRLLEQWLDHSALLRGFAPLEVRNGLWVRYNPRGGPFIRADRASPQVWRFWPQHHGLLADDGQPLRLHQHRIRTTFESMRDRRGWFGSPRATIDPNHSAAVEGDHYLSVGTPAQQRAVDEIIVTAQQDLLRKALAPRILPVADAAQAARLLPDLVAEHRLDDKAIAELVAGRRDVFVASCVDPLAGLHGPAGKPCPARPWVCLLCPLAIFTPRHCANLLRLQAFFARQSQQMTIAQYMAVFGVYATRISEVLACFDPAVLTRAAVAVQDNDDEVALRPEEITR